jgi:hypothetical protein
VHDQLPSRGERAGQLDAVGRQSVAYVVAEIRRTTGRVLDLDNPDHVSLNDGQAFEMIPASDTVGLFQPESTGQQDLVGRPSPGTCWTSLPTSVSSARAPSPGACPSESRHWPCPPPICRITGGLEALRARS